MRTKIKNLPMVILFALLTVTFCDGGGGGGSSTPSSGTSGGQIPISTNDLNIGNSAFINGISWITIENGSTSSPYHIYKKLRNITSTVKIEYDYVTDCSNNSLWGEGSYILTNYIDSNQAIVNGTLNFYIIYNGTSYKYIVTGSLVYTGILNYSASYNYTCEYGTGLPVYIGYVAINGYYYSFNSAGTLSTSSLNSSPAYSPPLKPTTLGCGDITYKVTYYGNNNTSGNVPVDSINYTQGSYVTIKDNIGNLVKIQDGISLLFTGWNTKADGSGTNYLAGHGFSISTSTVSLFAKWSILRGTGPAGGLVFYDKGSYSNGWRYTEAAPYNQSGGVEWGCNGILISGADGTAIGTGEQNTSDIEFRCLTPGTPADLSSNLIINGYDDWFLPSKDELHKMYDQLKTFNVGGFSSDYYWSSTENGPTSAWAEGFQGGDQNTWSKTAAYRVRAIRSF